MTKMQPEIKTKWLAALRSGKYAQGQGKLYNGSAFCCLGVLCDVMSQDSWEELSFDETSEPDTYLHEFGDSNEVLDSIFREEIGISSDAQDKLTKMNDGGKDEPARTFAQIADWIEENL